MKCTVHDLEVMGSNSCQADLGEIKTQGPNQSGPSTVPTWIPDESPGIHITGLYTPMVIIMTDNDHLLHLCLV